jgi:RND family efflux transporter MFP subunit
MTMPPPAVTVSYPVERDVIDSTDFTGRTAAVESVQVRARVWGHLQSINFSEGKEVKKGDVLFVIDPRPYAAALERAEGDVAQSEARQKRLEADSVRARDLLQARATSREDYDKVNGDLAEAQAAVRSARAARYTAQLNLEYTKILAPVTGVAGRALVTIGNLVQSGEMGGTILTTVVSTDPVYAYFDVDDLTLNRIRALVRNGSSSTAPQPTQSRATIFLGLAHEDGLFPHQGQIDFLDNQVDPGTGTLKARGVFDNKDGSLTPGLFARIRIPLGRPHRAILVSDRAVDTDQGQKVLFVVKADNVVEKRLVVLGGLHDGLREIVSGIKVGERVVVDGIQRVRGGVVAAPQLAEMLGSQPPRPAQEQNGVPADGPHKKS